METQFGQQLNLQKMNRTQLLYQRSIKMLQLQHLCAAALHLESQSFEKWEKSFPNLNQLILRMTRKLPAPCVWLNIKIPKAKKIIEGKIIMFAPYRSNHLPVNGRDATRTTHKQQRKGWKHFLNELDSHIRKRKRARMNR